MADGTSIFRPASENEKSDFVVLKKKNITKFDMFLDKVAKTQQKYLQKHIPFCTRCARIDFEKRAKNVVDESIVSQNAADVKELSVPELDTYGQRDRFELVDSAIMREDKLLDGIRSNVIVGKEYRFKCKVRGCGHTVQVLNDDLPEFEKWLKGDSKKEEPKTPTKTDIKD